MSISTISISLFQSGRFPVFALIAFVLVVPMGCSDGGGTKETPPKDGAASPPASGLFVEWTESAKLPPPQGRWPDGQYFTPEITPGGVAFFDFDNDGRLDILQIRHAPPGSWPEVINTAAPDRLFRNVGDGTFAEVPNAAGLNDPGYGHGCAIGDIDNDGFPEVFITNFGRSRLYKNNGNATFTDISDQAGIDKAEKWGTAAAFFDYDRDGFLDLWVVHFATFDPKRKCGKPGEPDYCGPHTFPGVRDTLYRNNGDSTFTDVSEKAGIKVPARGWGIVTADFNVDGWVDVLVANDEEPNQLWINKGNGTFVDEAVIRGVAVNGAGRVEANMGVAIGDLDGDGVFDPFITHLTGEKNTLWLSGGKEQTGPVPTSKADQYSDKSAASGMAAVDLPYTGWGCAIIDFDHDGDLDIAVANGRVALAAPKPGAKLGEFWNRYAEENLFFRNDGSAKFTSLGTAAGDFTKHFEITRGMALGDFDNDGDLDIATSTVGNTLRLYRNDAPRAGTHWLMVRAITGKRDALGARVELIAGGKRRAAAAITAYSYLASNDPRVHFGLGATAKVEGLEITWPDGKRERFEIPGVDRVVTVKQGGGTAVE